MAFTFTLSPYSSAEIGTGDKINTLLDGSGKNYEATAIVEFDGTQSDGDVIPLFTVYGNDVVVDGGYSNRALSGMTDVDIGLYDLDGTAVDADFFTDGDSLATAQLNRFGDTAVGALTFEDSVKKIGDISADVDEYSQYVVALTVNTAGSASGAFALKFDIIRSN